MMSTRVALRTASAVVASLLIVGCGHHGASSLMAAPPAAPMPPQPAALDVDDQPLSDFALTPEVNGPGAKPQLFVANASAVLGFLESANGNVAPSKKISGSMTGLSGANGVAVGPTGKIYVSTSSNGLLVFAASANGNVPPMQHIVAPAGIAGIAIDSTGNIYDAVSTTNAIHVYAPNATGSAAPIRVIAGTNTGLNNPKGIAVDVSNKIYIANGGANSITVYGAAAVGNAVPLRRIAGAATTIQSPVGIAVNVRGNIYLAERTGKFLVFGPTTNGNMPPARTVTGSASNSQFNGIARSIGGTTIVANATTTSPSHNEVDTFAPTAMGISTPTLVISGSTTGLAQPFGIGLFEQVQAVGARLSGELPTNDPNYGKILGYFNGTTSMTSALVSLTAGDPVQFMNVDTINPHTVSFLGNATATHAPFPPTFTGGGTTASAAGTFIGTPGFTTGTLTPGQKSKIYNAGGPGFYMIGCLFHYVSNGMRDVIIVR